MHFLNHFRKGCIAALALAPGVWPTVTMNGLFTNNMVLQHGMAVPVWGTAAAGENISVSINGQTKTAIAGTSGAWKVVLDSLAIGGPFQMAIHGANTITLTNVMVGDVWLCSGQSNITIGLGAFSYRDSLKTLTAGLGNVRLFSEKSDMHGIGPWYACSTSSIAGDFSATAFFFGKYLHDSLNIPIGLIVSAVGATFIEQWMPTQALIDDPELDTSTVMNGGNDGGLPNGLKAGGLYRGFIVPIQPFAIQGTIWYQGEWNTNPSLGSPNKYQTRFTELINGWRTEWGQGNFPFYFVQLHNFNSNDPWATIREAQRLTNKNVGNTGMAIAIDIGGNPPELHPSDKRDVGYRLALLALAHTYGHDKLVPSGPLFKSMSTRNDTAHLSFDYIGSGLITKNGTLSGFEIAAANDANFVAASATIASSEVIVYKPGSKVTRVRYAWASNPVSTLYNREGLPASPFMSYVSDITEAQRKGPISADAVRKGQTPGVVKMYDLIGRCIAQSSLSNRTNMPSANKGVIPSMGTLRNSTGVFIEETVSSDNRVINRKIMLFGKYGQPPLVTGKE